MSLPRTLFRPCIDIHRGKVKQIVGASLSMNKDGRPLKENFVSDKPASYFAKLYKSYHLQGGHIIMLDSDKEQPKRKSHGSSAFQALEALEAYPESFNIGGGISLKNAEFWLRNGAAKIIVTSSLFNSLGVFLEERLRQLSRAVGKERLVIDISAKAIADTDTYGNQALLASKKKTSKPSKSYVVMASSWALATNLYLQKDTFEMLGQYASMLMAHAVTLEGSKKGIDEDLVSLLAESNMPSVYCGGVSTLQDITRIITLGKAKVSFTVGSALLVYGGTLVLSDVIKAGRANKLKQ